MQQALALLALVLTTGCATIFSGSKQRITVVTDPPGAVVVVVGSPAAPMLLALESSAGMTEKVLRLLGPQLSPGAREKLSRLTLAELITRLVAWAKLDQIPEELIGEVAAIPPEVRGRLLGLFGVEDVGLSPLSVKLRKGRKYAVLSWKQGHEARLVGVHTRFNYVTLLNVFNAFLGVPIDILTGAWFSLKPSKIILELPVRGS